VHFHKPSNYHQAVAIQQELRAQVRPQGRIRWRELRTVAGADCSFGKRAKKGVGGIVVVGFPSLEPIAEACAVGPAEFPYIPGLLSFREIPLLIAAWKRLPVKPDIIICDAQGIAHPRGIGLASHFGLVLDLPTVGCAKTRLVGEHDQPAPERGSTADLLYDGRKVGLVLRTREGTKPVFVSPGHRVGHRPAAELVLRCSPRYRIPEVIRAAHHLVNRIRKEKDVQ
jgi:deoxyribonuclease V